MDQQSINLRFRGLIFTYPFEDIEESCCFECTAIKGLVKYTVGESTEVM
jgi:hypothetical protein